MGKRNPISLPSPETFYIETSLPKNEARQKLESLTRPKSFFSFWTLRNDRRPFCGTVDPDGFKIAFLQHQVKNPFKFFIPAEIEGTFIDARPTKIECVVKYPIFLRLFFTVWFCFAYFWLFSWLLAPFIVMLSGLLSDTPVNNVRASSSDRGFLAFALMIIIWLAIAIFVWVSFIGGIKRMLRRGMSESKKRIITVFNEDGQNHS